MTAMKKGKASMATTSSSRGYILAACICEPSCRRMKSATGEMPMKSMAVKARSTTTRIAARLFETPAFVLQALQLGGEGPSNVIWLSPVQ